MGRTRFKTALVLSGGAARAVSHLGVLEELQKDRIHLDMVVGTSMGAIIGALYAYYRDVDKASSRMWRFMESDLFQEALSAAAEESRNEEQGSLINRFLWLFKKGVYYTHSMIRSTLVSEEIYLEVMRGLIPQVAIEDLSIPFAAVAMDLLNGEEIILRKGSLRRAVSASAAIPGVLPPVHMDARLLVDGGWVDNIPVVPAIAMGAHFVLAVDASVQIPDLGPLPGSALDFLLRSNEISRILLNKPSRALADVLLAPDIGRMGWADFSDPDRSVAAGRAAVSANLKHIRRKRAQRRLMSLRGRIHPARHEGWQRPLIFY